jgi:hypothetical protein
MKSSRIQTRVGKRIKEGYYKVTRNFGELVECLK